jgi:hypothetical protein
VVALLSGVDPVYLNELDQVTSRPYLLSEIKPFNFGRTRSERAHTHADFLGVNDEETTKIG